MLKEVMLADLKGLIKGFIALTSELYNKS